MKNEKDKLRIAAESGVADAQCVLGLNYEENGDYAQAAHWLTLAAEQGDALAQIWLGDMYLRGEGVEQSDDKALLWYNKSAEKDERLAFYKLGLMYFNGWGVEQDYSRALVLMR